MDSSLRACKRDLVPLVAAVGLTLLVHAPSLDSAFARDDQLLLYDAANQPLGEYLFEMHGGHLMPVHKLIIAAMHGLFGYRAAPFFGLMLATHLLNVALFYAGLRGVVKAPLALFGAALWGAAIVHQSSLRWFSVFGQLLVASCFLLVFADWTLHRRRRGWPSRRALLRWNALLVVAGASFGVGIALALAAPLLASAFVAPSERRRTVVGLLPAALIVPALYALGFALSGASRGPLSGSLTWPVAAQLLVDLPAAGFASLMFGPAATQDAALILAGPLSARPIDGAFSALRYAALLPMLLIALGFVAAKRTLRRRMIGAAAVCVAIYALIALGRTQIAALMSVAQIATEPRYHYTSLLGAAMLLTFALAALGARLRQSELWHSHRAQKLGPIAAMASLIAWLSLLAIPSYRLAPAIQRASIARARLALEETLAGLSAAIARAPPGRDVHIFNSDYAAARTLFGVRNHPERFPGIAALFVVTHESATVGGKRVRFVEPRAHVLQAIRAKPDRRIASLVVSNVEASASGAEVYRLPLGAE